MLLLSRRFTSWTRLLLALSLAAAVAAFPCRARADDGNNGNGNNGNDGNDNGGGNGRGHGHRDAAQAAGTFVIIVRGYFTTDAGNANANSATVTATTVTFSQVPVKDDAGHAFLLNANLRITDNYHFSGNGTIGSVTVTIEGHVDPTDPSSRGNGQNRQVVSNPRLECTYTTADPANRHGGRVVGSLVPSATPASSSH
jgi:hypothetical protein